MEKAKKISPFRLSSLLRLQKDPNLALNLFLNPNPNPKSDPTPFRYSFLSYDLIIAKLGRAKMFDQMEQVFKMLKQETRFKPKEIMFCNIITFYAHGQLPDQALKIFYQIPSSGCERTIKSVNTLLNAMLSCRKFEKIREVFVGIGKYADPDACTYNILINACFLGGNTESAWEVFDEMCKRGIRPNVVTFGTLINGLCANSKLEEALRLKDAMSRDFEVKPNAFVYAALIKGLCKANELNAAFELKDEMMKNCVELDSAAFASLISALFKARRRGDAVGLVEELRQNGCKLDTVTYNSMIRGFCLEKDFNAAFHALDEMEDKRCKPDVITYNIIIGGLCMAGLLKEATDLFADMSKGRCVPDIVTYRTLFDGLCDGMQLKKAAFVLDEMVQKGYAPCSECTKKYVSRLGQGGDLKLLWTVINNLAKGNLIDAVTWEILVRLVCQNDSHIKDLELEDTLLMP